MQQEQTEHTARTAATGHLSPQQIKRGTQAMIEHLAAGLYEIQKSIDTYGEIYHTDPNDKKANEFPHPRHLVWAFNTAAALNIVNGDQQYPTDLYELMQKDGIPVREWCPEFFDADNENRYDPQFALTADGRITEGCIAVADAEGEDSEKKYFKYLIDICTTIHDQETSQAFYVDVRRAIIENPTAESLDSIISNDRYSTLRIRKESTDLLMKYYDSINATHVRNGKVALCPLSRSILTRSVDGWKTRMKDPEASRLLNERGPIIMAYTSQSIVVKPELLYFWVFPGFHELHLHNEAIRLGWKVDLWPEHDRYDLHISNASGTSYAVDVKDYDSPRTLAWNLWNLHNRDNSHKRRPPDNVIIVIPDYRARAYIRYKDIFHNVRLSITGNDESHRRPEPIMTISEFIKEKLTKGSQ